MPRLIDLVHQDLDPAAEFIDPLGLDRCSGFDGVEPAQQRAEIG